MSSGQGRRRDGILMGNSSAKDQLTNQAVAIKKIMKPFSTPVLAKRTYRELKLLKHLRHENVRPRQHSILNPGSQLRQQECKSSRLTCKQVISLSDIFISPLEDMYVARISSRSPEWWWGVGRNLPRQRDRADGGIAISLQSCSAQICTGY